MTSKNHPHEVPLDELITLIDSSTTERIFSDEFLARGLAAAAVLRQALEGQVDLDRAQAVAQDWVDAALDEEARCDLLYACWSGMETTQDPLEWRDLMIAALGLMSRQHLAYTMAGGLPEVLQ